ncbi:MAG TPA: SRPBCC family protein [Candidatus Limnocylindrales bacterium]
MRRVAGEALVGASRDEVWQLLDDLEGTPRWLPGVRSVSASGPTRVGTRYRTETMVLGMARSRAWEVVEHRPQHRQVRVASDGSVERRLVLTLDGRGSGTRLHAELQFRSALPFPVSLAHEVAAAAWSAGSAQTLVAAVKRAFEGRPR